MQVIAISFVQTSVWVKDMITSNSEKGSVKTITHSSSN